jgi:Do/DeqQ family serine protease
MMILSASASSSLWAESSANLAVQNSIPDQSQTLSSDPALASLQSIGQAFTRVAKDLKPSVVTVETAYQPPSSLPGESLQPTIALGNGSGLIYDPEGHIITNHHVIRDGNELHVVLNDGRRLAAEKIGEDPKTDLAVLRILTPPADLLPARFGNSDSLQVGNWVIAIGNPLGFSQTVTHGIVSAMGRSGLREDIVGAYENFIQTDASINQGNSGGPLSNLNGQVIGINSMIASQSGGSQGLGFSIPSNMVRRIVDQLIEKGTVTRGFLGVMVSNLSPEMAKEFNYKGRNGVVVDQISPGSPADLAGVKVGDILTQLEGRPIEDFADLRNRVSQNAPGAPIRLGTFRSGTSLNVVATLTHLKDPLSAQSQTGLIVRELLPGEKKAFKLNSGLIVDDVEAGSPAAKEGLQPGLLILSVDREKVNKVSDFHRLVTKSLAPADDQAVLLYLKDGESGFFRVLLCGEELTP